jgi:hypothetical protein
VLGAAETETGEKTMRDGRQLKCCSGDGSAAWRVDGISMPFGQYEFEPIGFERKSGTRKTPVGVIECEWFEATLPDGKIARVPCRTHASAGRHEQTHRDHE